MSGLGHQPLQLAIIPPLDTSFSPSRKYFLHSSPMFAMLHNKPTNLQILLKRKFFFIDLRSKIIQISFSYLFRCKFCIGGKVLGILELIYFHFSPSRQTRERTVCYYEGDQLRSLLDMEIRLYRE